MDILTKEQSYIDFLEAIIQAKDIESLYENTFPILQKTFKANRVQIWEEVSNSNEMSVSNEYCNSNEPSMLKFRVHALVESTKKIVQKMTLWEYPNVADKVLEKFNIKSLTGIELKVQKSKKMILILAFKEKDKVLNEKEKDFLTRLTTQLEINIPKMELLSKSTEELKRLLNQNTRLREEDHLRTNFINNISHELRTPLSSILGFSKMLSTKNHNTESTKEISQQIQHAANRLSSLITDFLQVSKTTTESWSTHIESCDIGEIIKKSVEEFSSLNKNHKIAYVISDNYPMLRTDPKLIRQVLDNLISNAIKYSPRGGSITVSLNFSKDKKTLNVSITDQGIGIDKTEVSKVFNRLYRSNNPEVQKITGSGLGLAICKEIITTLNGKIEVKSELNKGSTFSFSLPVN